MSAPEPGPLERWFDEQQSVWLYRSLVEIEDDARRKALFAGLAEAAQGQADTIAETLRLGRMNVPAFVPSTRARLVITLARRLGTNAVRGMLAGLKVRGLSAWDPSPAGVHATPSSVAEVGRRHRGGAGGTLRAAVFGVNDGLVSNTSLLLGVAGAAVDETNIVITGVAGLLAGAFSMAAGEYISMRSQRELFEHQIAEEKDELSRYPEQEGEELALIYAARGLPPEEARALARKLVADPKAALDTLAREELGVNPEDLGSPIGAALSSFAAFAVGAILPLVPYLLHLGGAALPVAVALAAAGLFGVGATLSLFSGRNAWWGGVRMLGIGAAAGAATFGIGSLFGAAVA